ncbi:MAG: 4-(cytidine 5'-diphospho)-2-C-methyl-D-erythritol kinase [Thermomicrobiales bacterium]
MTSCIARTPAKLNLGLEILGRREDGFHEIRTVMQTVSIYDHLTFTLAQAHVVELSCSMPALATEQNLACRAATMVRERYEVVAGAHLQLVKGIPIAAGLGGASSDAAATLRGTSALWSLSCTDADPRELASRLGSDVPFFLTGGTMLAEGRGERLTPLPPLAGVWFVVAVPRIELPNKTPRMYELLQSHDFTDGSTISALVDAMRARKPIEWDQITNRFERVSTQLVPEIEPLRHALQRAGAPFVSMTGAGPGQFTATDDPERADAIHAKLLRDIGPRAELFLCQAIPAVPSVDMV